MLVNKTNIRHEMATTATHFHTHIFHTSAPNKIHPFKMLK